MAETDAGELKTADREAFFKDGGKVYRRVRDQAVVDAIEALGGATDLGSDGQQLLITVTTTPVPVRVGGANMVGRELIIIQPQSGRIRHGFNGIDSSTGFVLFKNQYAMIPIGPDLDYYIVAESGSVDVLIAEAK